MVRLIRRFAGQTSAARGLYGRSRFFPLYTYTRCVFRSHALNLAFHLGKWHLGRRVETTRDAAKIRPGRHCRWLFLFIYFERPRAERKSFIFVIQSRYTLRGIMMNFFPMECYICPVIYLVFFH